MNVFIQGQAVITLLVLIFTNLADGNNCQDKLPHQMNGEILDTVQSVRNGADFLSAPKLTREEDCVSACCQNPDCNAALMEQDVDGSLKSCFLFNCFYKKINTCHFVKKNGFKSTISSLIYKSFAFPSRSRAINPPPVANAGPDRVVQPNQPVKLSGFLSTDQEKIVSYDWKIVGDHPYIKMEKATFKDEMIFSNMTSGMYTFELTVKDDGGQTDSTTINVLVLTNEQSEHHCMAPYKSGPCRGSFPRWHYNAASGQCEEFIYGGCKSNLNYYLTQDECKAACSGIKSTGPAGRSIPKLIPECGVECTGFKCADGCCLPAEAECDGQPQCSDGSDENGCTDLSAGFTRLLAVHVNEKKAMCTEQPDPGTCGKKQTKWYYDPISLACYRFHYTGCGGNSNKFDDNNKCMEACKDVTEKDVVVRSGDGETGASTMGESAMMAIGIILIVAIIIALICGIYCFVTRSKKRTAY